MIKKSKRQKRVKGTQAGSNPVHKRSWIKFLDFIRNSFFTSLIWYPQRKIPVKKEEKVCPLRFLKAVVGFKSKMSSHPWELEKISVCSRDFVLSTSRHLICFFPFSASHFAQSSVSHKVAKGRYPRKLRFQAIWGLFKWYSYPHFFCWIWVPLIKRDSFLSSFRTFFVA